MLQIISLNLIYLRKIINTNKNKKVLFKINESKLFLLLKHTTF